MKKTYALATQTEMQIHSPQQLPVSKHFKNIELVQQKLKRRCLRCYERVGSRVFVLTKHVCSIEQWFRVLIPKYSFLTKVRTILATDPKTVAFRGSSADSLTLPSAKQSQKSTQTNCNWESSAISPWTKLHLKRRGCTMNQLLHLSTLVELILLQLLSARRLSLDGKLKKNCVR